MAWTEMRWQSSAKRHPSHRGALLQETPLKRKKERGNFRKKGGLAQTLTQKTSGHTLYKNK